MADQLDEVQGHYYAVHLLNQVVSEAVVTLLETKHLYQKVTVDLGQVLEPLQERLLAHLRSKFTPRTFRFKHASLGLDERSRTDARSLGTPMLLLQNLKLFCRSCDAPEVFSPLWFQEVADAINQNKAQLPTLELPLKDMFQAFVLAYQCQRCKSDPTIFVVRRNKWTFSMDGRSPIEQVTVPREIPKQETGYFRDAIIAYQSGKPLAGILYLRVFLEAFARRETGVSLRMSGDELMDEYAKLISVERRSVMPSLKEWYGKLSEAIHAGSEDSELFENANSAIHTHFEFRRLFSLPDKHD